MEKLRIERLQIDEQLRQFSSSGGPSYGMGPPRDRRERGYSSDNLDDRPSYRGRGRGGMRVEETHQSRGYRGDLEHVVEEEWQSSNVACTSGGSQSDGVEVKPTGQPSARGRGGYRGSRGRGRGGYTSGGRGGGGGGGSRSNSNAPTSETDEDSFQENSRHRRTDDDNVLVEDNTTVDEGKGFC
ncbi:hypothetical protein BSL78_22260 [Apostichopus japonicus]|uniref:Fragile X messenger ribonucleoprotein 1-like C-terminal core domain-containing protein n=1 Tax=Stichopus japonicus TaxID=307972 RepID=A0A2G8JYW2_STIJA|nr:hypothetical protein BSL78_22260 [Apostichopus japonicus]